MCAKAQHDVKRVRRIRDLIARNEKSIDQQLTEWPKSKMFNFAANILINEGKGRLVVKDGKLVKEIDLAEVILKLADIFHGIEKVARNQRRRDAILHEEFTKASRAKQYSFDAEIPQSVELTEESELSDVGTFEQ